MDGIIANPGKPPGWSRGRALAALVVCNLLWAGTYVTGKTALAAFSSTELNCLRFILASVALVPLALWGPNGYRPRRADLPQLALLCGLGFVLNKAAEYSGLALTTASDTALLIASESVFTALLAWMLLREPVHRGAVIGLCVGAVGVYLVIERGLVLPHLGGGTRVAGDLLVVLSLIFEALYTVLGKRALPRFTGLVTVAAGCFGSLAVWIPAAAFEVARDGPPHPSTAAWFGLAYLAFGSTLISAVLWMMALRYVDAATAGVTLFIQPLAGTVLAVVTLGEHPTPFTVIGGVIIALGVWIAGRARGREGLPAEFEEEALGTHA